MTAFPAANTVNNHERRTGPLQVQGIQKWSPVLHRTLLQKLGQKVPASAPRAGGKMGICWGPRQRQLLCLAHVGNKKQQTDVQSDTKLWSKLSAITPTHPDISAKHLLRKLLYKGLDFLYLRTFRRQNRTCETSLKYGQNPILSKTLLHVWQEWCSHRTDLESRKVSKRKPMHHPRVSEFWWTITEMHGPDHQLVQMSPSLLAARSSKLCGRTKLFPFISI